MILFNSKNDPESMMRDFVNEGYVQPELDFGRRDSMSVNPDDYKADRLDIMADEYEERRFDRRDSMSVNPDDYKADRLDIKADEYEEQQWFPVYDLIEDAKSELKPGCAEFNNLKQLMSGNADCAVATYFDDVGDLNISHRWTMFDPLDGEFSKQHSPFLGKIASAMPKGFAAEFTTGIGKPGDYIGTKYINDKYTVGDEDTRYGSDVAVNYDVVETLTVRKAALDESAEPEFDQIEESGFEDDTGDCYECDFPAWALDYMVNAELGSVSRQEKQQIDDWIRNVEQQGYDTGAITYGDEEYFSNSPEFGLPCDCVTARICKNSALLEAVHSNNYDFMDQLDLMMENNYEMRRFRVKEMSGGYIVVSYRLNGNDEDENEKTLDAVQQEDMIRNTDASAYIANASGPGGGPCIQILFKDRSTAVPVNEAEFDPVKEFLD